MTERTLPPPCPNCGAKTALREMHRLARDEGFMCFFWCEPCALEYPLVLGPAEIALAGAISPTARKRPGSDPREKSGK